MSTRTLPLPVARLQRRSHNAKSAKDMHDAAYFAWEVSVRLAVALDGGPAGERSVGAWVRALDRPTERLPDPRLRAVARLLGQEGLGRPLGGRETTARGILDALPAYRNRVIGHGSVRPGAYYEPAGRVLLDGLEAAWEAEVFWPAGTVLSHVESITAAGSGEPRARVLDLMGNAPLVRDPAGTAVRDDLVAGRVYACALEGATWTSLHPWLLFFGEEGHERVLCFDALLRTHARYLDYATGSTLSGRALEAQFPGVFADVQAAMEHSAAEADDEESTETGEQFGSYAILGRIGQGAMGVVYLARQQRIGRHVALKTLPDAMAENPVALGRFRREVLALSRCEHPNVVKILDSGVEDGSHYYAMEYVEGAPLSAVAKAYAETHDLAAAISTAAERVRDAAPERFEGVPVIERAAVEGLPERDRWRHLARLFRGAAEGLHHLHECGVVHRDIKPDNIIVTERDHRAVIMDLGLAQIEDASQALTRQDQGILGTLRYMPPEQLRMDLADIDRRTDVYALGATLYELATETPMLDGDTVPRLVEQVLHTTPKAPDKAAPSMPADLATVIAKATHKDPARRYATALDMARDLDAFAQGQAVSAHPTTLRYVLGLTMRRHKALTAAVLGAVALVIVGTLLFINHLRDVRDTEFDLRQEAQTALSRAENLADSLRTEKEAAEAARAKAELHLKHGEELAAFMFRRLGDDLQQIGRLPLLARAARKAKAWYDEMDTATAPWTVRSGRANSYERFAQVLLAEGDLEGAGQALRTAVGILRGRLDSHPDDVVAARDLSMVEASLALYHRRRRELDKAAELLRGAIKRVTALDQSEDPQGLAYELAAAQIELGEVLAISGQIDDALGQYGRALETIERLPEDERARNTRESEAYFFRGRTLMHAGRSTEARRDLEEAVRLLRARRVADESDGALDTGVISRLGDVLGALRSVARQQGDGDTEDACIKEQLTVRSQLAGLDPTNTDWRLSLADARMDMGRRLDDQGRHEEAYDWLSKAGRVRAMHAAGNPSDVDAQRNAAVVHHYLSGAAQGKGDMRLALRHIEHQETLLRGALKHAKDASDIDYVLVLAMENRHNLLARLGKLDDARGIATKVLEQMIPIVERDPANAVWMETLARAHRRVGDHMYYAKRPKDAVPHYEKALRIFDRLLARDPDDAHVQARRITTLRNLAGLLAILDRYAEAQTTQARAQKLFTAVEQLPGRAAIGASLDENKTWIAELEAAAPFRTGSRKAASAAEHVVAATGRVHREEWVEAAGHFASALEGEQLPDALPDRRRAIQAAAQAARAADPDAPEMTQWLARAVAWIRADLASVPESERAVWLKALNEDRLLMPLFADTKTAASIRALQTAPPGR